MRQHLQKQRFYGILDRNLQKGGNVVISLLDIELIFRLVLASVCGFLIGYERKSHAKAAGVRTHAVVACASALMMILSKYAYTDLLELDLYGDAFKIDPSRIASGVVSGIGFLGAGLIFVNKKMVMGLTTAAGIWATSGIGMAIGAGLYLIGISASVLLLILQIVLHAFPRNGVSDSSAPVHQAVANLETRIMEDLQSENPVGEKVYTITITTASAKHETASKEAEHTETNLPV